MDRREAVKNMAFLMGGALSATTVGVFLEGCNSPSTKTNGSLFTQDHLKLIAEVADIIIPDTNTPGAKAAGVGPFIALMIRDCYPEPAQQAFVKGLDDLEASSKTEFSKSFLEITVAERQQLLGKLRDKTVAETKAEQELLDKQKENAGAVSILPKDKPATEPRFFAIARDLTLLGYFTSEIGATKALDYVYIPGRYDGCVDLKPGQRLYAS